MYYHVNDCIVLLLYVKQTSQNINRICSTNVFISKRNYLIMMKIMMYSEIIAQRPCNKP